jgi:hypothetical protein
MRADCSVIRKLQLPDTISAPRVRAVFHERCRAVSMQRTSFAEALALEELLDLAQCHGITES